MTTTSTAADRPGVAVLRGEALNPFELQSYAHLLNRFDVLAVGRRRPPYEVADIQVPVRLLHAAGQSRVARGTQRRIARLLGRTAEPARLQGLASAVAGRAVLHAAETVLPVSEQGAELAVEGGPRLVLTCWETIPFRYDDNPTLARRKRLVKARTSHFLAVTPRAREALLEEGVPEELVSVVPAGVDCSRFRPGPADADLLRAWDIPEGGRVVLYVGRLIPEKGIVELVRAFASVASDLDHLVILGNGSEQGRITRAAEALGVDDRVHVRPGQPYRDLPRIYATADVVVAPSLTTPYWEEQFGMVLVEAMACGRPLLTTRSGAIPEVVGEAAALVTPYDVRELAATLGELLADPSRRAELGQAGRARATSRYDGVVVADRIAEVYDRVVAGVGS